MNTTTAASRGALAQEWRKPPDRESTAISESVGTIAGWDECERHYLLPNLRRGQTLTLLFPFGTRLPLVCGHTRHSAAGVESDYDADELARALALAGYSFTAAQVQAQVFAPRGLEGLVL